MNHGTWRHQDGTGLEASSLLAGSTVLGVLFTLLEGKKKISQLYPAVNPVKAKNHICLAQHACGCHSSTDIMGVTTHFLFGFQSHLMDRTCSWHPLSGPEAVIRLSVTVLSGDWCLSLSSSKKLAEVQRTRGRGTLSP